VEEIAMTRLTIIIFSFVIYGCQTNSGNSDKFDTGLTSQAYRIVNSNMAISTDDDGNTTFYTGNDIGDIIRQRLTLDNYQNKYVEVFAPKSLVDRAISSPNSVSSCNLSDICGAVIIIHNTIDTSVVDSNAIVTKSYHSGDAWLTGVMQILNDSDSGLISLYKIIKYTPYSNRTVSMEEITTGIANDLEAEPYCCRPGDDGLPLMPYPVNWTWPTE
jgi:hypothetical protein